MLFNELIARYRRWKSVHETIVALDGLSTRELDDLGIGRWRIPDLAKRHAVWTPWGIRAHGPRRPDR